MTRVNALFALALLSLLSAAGCATNPYTGRSEVSLISREQEVEIGRQAAPQFEAEFGGRYADARVQGYVRGVGLRVAAISDRAMPYDFAALDSKTPNAFALPGGPVYVTTGLLKIMNSERELAAVLAHEVGHIAAKHTVNGLQRQMGAAVLIEAITYAAGSRGASAGKIAEIVLNIRMLEYSRDDEYEADEAGIVYMMRAGYNPYGMVEMLGGLQGLSQSEPGLLAEMLSTHPLTSKRVEEARDIVRKKFPAVDPRSADPNAAQFLELKATLR